VWCTVALQAQTDMMPQYTHTHTPHTYIHRYTNIYIHTQIHKHIYIHTDTRAHTHTHTLTHKWVRLVLARAGECNFLALSAERALEDEQHGQEDDGARHHSHGVHGEGVYEEGGRRTSCNTW
jgi:hypothetical protein